MPTISIRGLHHQHVSTLAFCRPRMQYASRCDLGVTHAANVAGEQQSFRLAIELECYLHHRRTDDVRGRNEPETEIGTKLLHRIEVNRLKLTQALLRLLEGVKRQGG